MTHFPTRNLSNAHFPSFLLLARLKITFISQLHHANIKWFTYYIRATTCTLVFDKEEFYKSCRARRSRNPLNIKTLGVIKPPSAAASSPGQTSSSSSICSWSWSSHASFHSSFSCCTLANCNRACVAEPKCKAHQQRPTA